MKATLKMSVTKEIKEEDRGFFEDLLSDGDITSLYEIFEPEYEGKHELEFGEEG